MSGACRDALSIVVVEDDPAVAELVRTVPDRVPDWGATVVPDAAAASGRSSTAASRCSCST